MTASVNASHTSSGLRLQTTVRLRWVGVVGQLTTVLFVHQVLGFQFPLLACLGVIAASALMNLALTTRHPTSKRLNDAPAMWLMGFDTLQLVVLLFLTGGLKNPFALLIVVPIAVSASSLPLSKTMVLAGFAIVCATGLIWFHLPLPWAGQPEPVLPSIYIFGVWTALTSCIVFSAVYSWRVGRERRQMSEALSAAEMVLAREQRLSALDGLAAAAAHELGTPLGTITLTTKELLRSLPEDSPHYEDVALVRSQAERCREILGRLAGRTQEQDEMFERMPIGLLIEEAIEPYRQAGKAIAVSIDAPERADSKAGGEPVMRRNPGIIYGLGNLVENAVDFAHEQVKVEATWDNRSVRVTIRDDGPGFQAGVIGRLGEPYVTTRPQTDRRGAGPETGLGLGFFIAKTLLERSGARLELRNARPPETGAVVEIIWPRETFYRTKALGDAA
ncbi:MAG: ActS/PrrB/RegB family redox-sensitive histidine kinase [Dichotomicrobium sp.]